MSAALTIAGSDPTGGAGLQADLRVFNALGVYGYSITAALTAQSTTGVRRVEPVSEGMLWEQLCCLLDDLIPGALKTGLLYSPHAVRLTARAVREYSLNNLVIDPVTVSSTGVSLVDEGALDAIKSELFPLSRAVTPNIYEASVFTGLMIENERDMERAARALKGMGPDVVVVTGGHLEGLTVDLFFDGQVMHALRSPKIEGEYHGTGCAFSAAMCALLSLGRTPLEATRGAKDLIQRAIGNATHPGRGMGILGI